MKVKCEYCGAYIDETEEKCPNCGAVSMNHSRNASDTPKTIMELKCWYNQRNLPPYETTRFFIGVNYLGPRAFGIYNDGPDFIVYKNKEDGSRSIRYRGTDEAYAVNELYLRLKEEILHQKSRNLSSGKSADKLKKKRTTNVAAIIALIVAVLFLGGILGLNYYLEHCVPVDNAYYLHDDTLYYHDPYGTWWQYDEKTGDYKKRAEYLQCTWRNPSEGYIDGISMWNSKNDFVTNALHGIYDSGYTSGLSYEDFYKKYRIDHSKAYIDDFHPLKPENSGYYYDGKDLYYHVGGKNSSSNPDYDGWYRYENDDWSFYAEDREDELLSDALRYNSFDYFIGPSIIPYVSGDIYNGDGITWEYDADTFKDFEDSDIYSDYLEAEAAVRRSAHTYYSDSDSSDDSYDDHDSDYDWDSNDSWDSGDTDWDSDW